MPTSSRAAPVTGGDRAAGAPRATGFPLATHAAAALLGVVLLRLISDVVLSGPTRRPVTLADSSLACAFGIFALAGFVVALRQPRNAIGWILLGTALFGLLSSTGGSYADWDYRFSHGSLPLGVVAVFLQLDWAPAIALFPLPVLLFPDGHRPSRLEAEPR